MMSLSGSYEDHIRLIHPALGYSIVPAVFISLPTLYCINVPSRVAGETTHPYSLDSCINIYPLSLSKQRCFMVHAVDTR